MKNENKDLEKNENENEINEEVEEENKENQENEENKTFKKLRSFIDKNPKMKDLRNSIDKYKDFFPNSITILFLQELKNIPSFQKAINDKNENKLNELIDMYFNNSKSQQLIIENFYLMKFKEDLTKLKLKPLPKNKKYKEYYALLSKHSKESYRFDANLIKKHIDNSISEEKDKINNNKDNKNLRFHSIDEKISNTITKVDSSNRINKSNIKNNFQSSASSNFDEDNSYNSPSPTLGNNLSMGNSNNTNNKEK